MHEVGNIRKFFHMGQADIGKCPSESMGFCEQMVSLLQPAQGCREVAVWDLHSLLVYVQWLGVCFEEYNF